MKTKLTLIITLLTFFIQSGYAQENKQLPNGIEGAWTSIAYKYGAAEIYTKKNTAQPGVYLITKNKFNWVNYDKKTGQVLSLGGGTCILGEGEMTQIYEYTLGKSIKMLQNQKVTGSYKIQKNKWYWTAKLPNGLVINEIWERVENKQLPKGIEGAWTSIAYKFGAAEVYAKLPPGRRWVKLITKNKFNWINYDIETGQVTSMGGGTYKIGKGQMIQTHEYISDKSWEYLLTKKVTGSYKIQENKYHWAFKRPNGTTINEIWERDKTKPLPRDFKSLKASAENGDAKAQYNLGVSYHNGQGVKQDLKEAMKWYRKAAEQEWVIAQTHLGQMYRFGNGVKQDEKEALKWFHKSAEQGHSLGQVCLAQMYRDGKGVKQDYKKAIEWFTKAADQGQPYANRGLGHLHLVGWGVPKDNEKAYAWFTISVANGLADAKKSMSSVAKRMTPEQIAKAEALAKEMIKKNPKLLKK